MAEEATERKKTILVAEDSEADRKYLTTLLTHHHYRVIEARDGGEALELALRERPDLVISDIRMPVLDGYEFIQRLQENSTIGRTRVVFYTATYEGEGTPSLAPNSGVLLLLKKPSEPEVILRAVAKTFQMELPTGSPERPAEEFARRHARLLADSLREAASERDLALGRSRRYRDLIDGALYGICRTSRNGLFLDANPALAKMLGYESASELVGRNTSEFYLDQNESNRVRDAYLQTGKVRGVEVRLSRKDGQELVARISGRAVNDFKGETVEFEGMVEDVSQQRALELRLRQSEKLEAVGRLAGGIAHDFNNNLGIILGHADLLLEQFPPNAPMRKHCNVIKEATLRAASLTKQLLAFGRKQVFQPVTLNLNTVITEMNKLLRPVIGERIELLTVLEPELGDVEGDPAHLEQVIMSLAVNARDAMPDGGRITIETSNRDLDDLYQATHPVVKPGPYVLMTMTDTGKGMDKEMQQRIFEPFYTTKGLEAGAGMGLASVYGIVKQSGGYIWAYSELDRGTTMKVYLPRVNGANAPAFGDAKPSAMSAQKRTETILIVEDEELLRNALCAFVASSGYRVLAAKDGTEAIEVSAKEANPIQLLITDVIMPGMNGRQLAEALRASQPGMRVLYVSGYTDATINRDDLVGPGIAFLQKPFTKETLLRQVAGLLKG